MSEPIYRELLGVMKSRGGPYAGMDVPEFFALVEELFSPAEAEVNNALSRKPSSAEDVAAGITRKVDDVRKILESMADKGLCGVSTASGTALYQGLPFMPGIFEFHFMAGEETDHLKRIAELIHAYKKAYESAGGIQKISFPVTRVIPVDRTIKVGNVIHTYDRVMTYIQKYDSIAVGTCFCRHAARLRGEDIHGMPLEVCMCFGNIADNLVERLGGRRITKEEAKEILDRSEEAGLIHMSRNTTEEIDFMCNCERWHCEVVSQVLKQPKPGWVFNSGYQPTFDPKRCLACETCIERCPPGALHMGEDSLPTVSLDRCFGCGACATGCPEGAIAMDAKPDFPAPPGTVKELAAALRSGTGNR
jgi:Pyruvate/2-oxoacid:ferredoxin oxidoreductase delta subunit